MPCIIQYIMFGKIVKTDKDAGKPVSRVLVIQVPQYQPADLLGSTEFPPAIIKFYDLVFVLVRELSKNVFEFQFSGVREH